MSTTVWSLPPQSQLHFRAVYVRRVRERSGNAAVSAVVVTGQLVKADSLSWRARSQGVSDEASLAGRSACSTVSNPPVL